MDPYLVLGVAETATVDEIRQAFRREASRWHPDKAGDTELAIRNFQNVNRAYQEIRRRHIATGDNADAASTSKESRFTDVEHDDELLDTLFEYAVSLARTGLAKAAVESTITDNGYDKAVAASLTEAAFDYREKHPTKNYAEFRDRKYNSFFKGDKIDDRLTQVFLGGDYPFTGSLKKRQTINYYQDTFRHLFIKDADGSRYPATRNRYLWKTLLRAVLLALLVFTAVFFLPAVGRLIPLGDLDLLQLPNLLLSLMLVWAAHKKLLELFLTGLLVFTASQYYFYTAMPGAMEEGIWAVTSVILIVFTPFLFLVFWSNAFYFQHAKQIIESICLHFHDDSERMLLVKKQGGTSVRLASLTAAGLALYFLHMIPEQGSLQSKLATLMGKQAPMAYEQELAQAQQRASRSQQFFTDAERHYHAAAPNYRRAAEAYYAAMDAGSLLAAYKLAYMHLHGQGVARNDSKALHFFHQAIKAPLSSQPHQLSVATHWLAESYASLGIMYLAAYGTKSDQSKSGKMFQQAAQFGVPNRRLDAIRAGFRRGDNLRQLVSAPNFN